MSWVVAERSAHAEVVQWKGLERLAAGEDHLAGLAAELGFADQSHLTRVMRAETGLTPGRLRGALRWHGRTDGVTR